MNTLVLAVFAHSLLFAAGGAHTSRQPGANKPATGVMIRTGSAPQPKSSDKKAGEALSSESQPEVAPAPETAQPGSDGALDPAASAPEATPLLNQIRSRQQAELMEEELPLIYDNAAAQPGEPVHAVVIENVRREYRHGLKRVGFKDFAGRIEEALESPELTESQREVLTFNRWTQVFTDARENAVEVMAGMAERGFSAEAMESAAELTARLLSLQPTEAPSTLPSEVAKQDKDRIVDWFTAVTVQNVARQLERVVSDFAKAIASPAELESLPEPLMKRISAIKERAERQLVHMYTNAEAGQTRFQGRALAWSLVRFAKVHDRPEVVASLKAKLRARDLYLENFVGDTLMVPDRSQADGARAIKLKSGDFIGERSAGKEAAEITYAVRPPMASGPRP